MAKSIVFSKGVYKLRVWEVTLFNPVDEETKTICVHGKSITPVVSKAYKWMLENGVLEVYDISCIKLLSIVDV